MPLPKFLRRQAPPPAEPDPVWAGEPGAVQQARVQARRRLLGAVVLLGVGVVLFPLLFETEPRPVSTDLPIQVARRDAGPVLTVPAASPAASLPVPGPLPAAEGAASAALSAPTPATAPASAPASAAAVPIVARAPATAPSAAAVSPVGARPPAPVAVVASASRPARLTQATTPSPAPAARAASAAAATPGAAAPSTSPPPTTAPAASAPAGRFVIQVGAFSDPVALRDARARVEKLGLRTFTQDVETPAGRRTRVRVGPFATREQADAAAVRLKAAGLPAYILAP